MTEDTIKLTEHLNTVMGPRGYRGESTQKILGKRSILDCALDVHMTATGSFERSQAEQNDDVNVLYDVLRNWHPSSKFSERFDDAVKQLIAIAIYEATN